MRYLGRPTPREMLRDEVIPFHLGVYERLDRLGTWAAESAGDGEFLGWFHFRPGPDGDITNIDLGYRLRRPAWNKGYATEGSRALISMGFTDLGVQRVFGHTMTVNTASRRVLEKCGLTLVRTHPYQGPVRVESGVSPWPEAGSQRRLDHEDADPEAPGEQRQPCARPAPTAVSRRRCSGPKSIRPGPPGLPGHSERCARLRSPARRPAAAGPIIGATDGAWNTAAACRVAR